VTFLLAASAGQQLSTDLVAAALKAAMSAQRPDLTLQLLHAQVLTREGMTGSDLLAAVGHEPGLIALCQHLLSTGDGTSRYSLPAEQMQQAVVVQLVQQAVAGGQCHLVRRPGMLYSLP
jgi:hypothetical protein